MKRLVVVFLMILSCFNLKTYVEQINLKIEGMSCTTCARMIAKRLLELKNIKDVTFHEANKSINLTLFDKSTFNIFLLSKIIERPLTNYKIKEININATGIIKFNEKKCFLELDNNGDRIYLEVAEPLQHSFEKSKKNEPKKELKHHKNLWTSSKKAWEKTNKFFKEMLGHSHFSYELLKKLQEKKSSVRLHGIVHVHVDGTLWATSKRSYLEEINTPHTL